VDDLPRSLAAIGSRKIHQDDYFLFGELLVGETDTFTDDLSRLYGADVKDLFGGFFFGNWIDGAFGDGVTNALSF